MVTHHTIKVEAKYLALGDKIVSVNNPPKTIVAVGYTRLPLTDVEDAELVRISFQDSYTPPEAYKEDIYGKSMMLTVERPVHHEVGVHSDPLMDILDRP